MPVVINGDGVKTRVLIGFFVISVFVIPVTIPVRFIEIVVVRLGRAGPWELYDLSTDRTELRNLASAQPGKIFGQRGFMGGGRRCVKGRRRRG